MPVLASPSPSRRLGSNSYSSSAYSSSSSSYSSYSRTPSTYSSRTSSLDRSPYSSYVSSYKYSSNTSASKDYTSSRPPSGSSSWRSTSVTPSYYSSTRASPARSYLTRKSSTEESSCGTRTRDTHSESRDTNGSNNNNLSNGTYKRSRDTSSYTPSSYSTSSALSRYKTDRSNINSSSSSSGTTSRSKYSDLTDLVKTDLPKISERIRSFEPPPTTTFKSRFLRSSQENISSVSELRRRYDLNHNDLNPSGSRKDSLSKPLSLRSRSGSESEESDRDSLRIPGARLSIPSLRVQNSPTPDRSLANGTDHSLSDIKEKNKKLNINDVPRSSSPSTLSSSSDGEVQDVTGRTSPGPGRRSPLSRSNKLTSRGSRNSISDSGSESSPSPKLAARAQSNADPGNQLQQAGLVGLRNIGNTCFMNSVLQCLSNTRAVLEYVLSEEYVNNINTTTSSMNGALMKAFASVLSELWKQDSDDRDSYSSSAVNPTALKSQIQKFAPRFMGYNQQDSQEFLRYLLEGLHEDVNRISVKPKPPEHDISDNLSDNQKAIESWKRYLRRDDSKIVDLFVGQLKSTLQCTVCGHCSVTFDPFWDLSLPIPASTRSSTSHIKLQQCLDLFAKEEILDGDEKPTCSKCQARQKCTKSFSIHKFPQILVLHLKRFSPGERFRKLDANVDFPLTDLDLSAYTAPGLRPTSCSYQLYGVINHSGSAYSGHYTASCRHPFSSTWHEYNDSRVSSISAQRVVTSEAYLLFYELESHEARL